MNVDLFLKCESQIGVSAAIAILNGEPVVMAGWVLFLLNGCDCAWEIDTSPPNLLNQSTDRQHQDFYSLKEDAILYEST